MPPFGMACVHLSISHQTQKRGRIDRAVLYQSFCQSDDLGLVSAQAGQGAIIALRPQPFGSRSFFYRMGFQDVANADEIATCGQAVWGMVTELVLSDVTCGADGDLLDYAQVIGRPDLCAAAGIVCPDVDRANLQAKRPRHDRVSRFVVSRTAGLSLVNHVAIAPAAWGMFASIQRASRHVLRVHSRAASRISKAPGITRAKTNAKNGEMVIASLVIGHDTTRDGWLGEQIYAGTGESSRRFVAPVAVIRNELDGCAVDSRRQGDLIVPKEANLGARPRRYQLPTGPPYRDHVHRRPRAQRLPPQSPETVQHRTEQEPQKWP